MTRIHMDTEAVRETARLLDWTCGELYYMPPKLKNLAGSLSSAWQGGRSGHYAGELRRMGEILQREVINLQRLAIRVRNEVEEWEGADAAFGKVISDIVNTPEKSDVPWWKVSETLRGFVEDIGTIGSGLAISSLIGGMAMGASYTGQVIFKGGQSLKEMAGISSHLTHIKAANLPGHLLTQSKNIQGMEILMGVWEFAEKGAKDWAQYEKGSERAAALSIDALFVAGTAVTTQYATYAITTAGVSLLTAAGAPAILVAGGGLAIWWGGSYLVKSAIDTGYEMAESSGVKNSMVKAGGSLFENIEKEIQKTAEAVDRFFEPVIQNSQVYEM
ncbi:MAG: hypothetical protein HONDAALG_04486 [Gammaproteobacteria bacterium]|nr:hypothetical protein [Gammaproteobacteria bacterium]